VAGGGIGATWNGTGEGGEERREKGNRRGLGTGGSKVPRVEMGGTEPREEGDREKKKADRHGIGRLGERGHGQETLTSKGGLERGKNRMAAKGTVVQIRRQSASLFRTVRRGAGWRYTRGNIRGSKGGGVP